VNETTSSNVNALLDSIALEKQVVLKSYRSSHSSIVTDRLVEPIQFGANMVDVLCYELSSNSCKSFKVARIEQVVKTETDWKFKERHEKIVTDSFRFSSTSLYEVTLKLSMIAANLLVEEYPLTTDKIERISDTEYIYKDKVCSYEGVGRFVLGLCNEIEIIDCPLFLKFLKKKREGSKF